MILIIEIDIMARRTPSLGHGGKEANPYESSHFKKSPWHREHRSKKGRQKKEGPYDSLLDFKRRKTELKEKDLDRDIKNYQDLMKRQKKWYST